MAARSTFYIFEEYQRSRWCFVQNVANLALKPQNIPSLEKCQVTELLKPLLNDISPQIRQCAAVALGRIVSCDAEVASKMINENFLQSLLRDGFTDNKHERKATLFMLRSLCKHNSETATAVVNSGAMAIFINALEDFEPCVKEAAAWAIGYVARHNADLARKCVDAGAIHLLILCLQEPNINLKQVAASALSDIAKHNTELAQEVVDAGAIPYLARNLNNEDSKLKRQILACLSACTKHSSELAECAIEAEIFPSVLLHLCHQCKYVRRNAACLVRDIVKHSLELTQLVVNTGGIAALIEVLSLPEAETRIPAITALGYIAGHSDQLAITVLGCKAVVILSDILNHTADDLTLCVTIWTLGQIGKHSPEHAEAIAAANVFPRLIQLYSDPRASEDLQRKCKVTLKLCMQKCLLLSALEPLLYQAPGEILKYILAQYSKILPHDPKARRLFVTTGALKKVQELDAPPGSALREYINVINDCFPEEVVRYYSPGYPNSLLEKVEQYSPQVMTMIRESNMDETEAQTEFSNLFGDDAMSSDSNQQLPERDQ